MPGMNWCSRTAAALLFLWIVPMARGQDPQSPAEGAPGGSPGGSGSGTGGGNFDRDAQSRMLLTQMRIVDGLKPGIRAEIDRAAETGNIDTQSWIDLYVRQATATWQQDPLSQKSIWIES